jgi:hypothetical protein
MDKANSIHTIKDLLSDKRITTHIHNLRPFIYDRIRTNLLTVAQHNGQEFIVESILGHRGDRNRRSLGKLGTKSNKNQQNQQNRRLF